MQKKTADASALYGRAAREYPLSYYALMAMNRLRESAAPDEKKLVDELAAPAATADDLAWRFAPAALYGNAAFQRGVELARLGLGTDARRELSAAGIRTEKKGAKVDDPARADALWLAAVLYDRAGEWALSHAIPRYVVVDYARRWPSGDNRKRWMISFPRGYEALVVEHAGKNGQPAALQFAIIREESAFDPLDESFANAVGLTQLTQAPAKRFAQGLPFTREALRDPVVNITIGARELGDLWKHNGGAAPLAIAGYNAGDGAVRRWLKALPAGAELDEFIERIPYDETRGYTKRVLGSYFAYHWLYETGDPVPSVPSALKSQ
jgi:soluble lytic murein transglycosylase